MHACLRNVSRIMLVRTRSFLIALPLVVGPATGVSLLLPLYMGELPLLVGAMLQAGLLGVVAGPVLWWLLMREHGSSEGPSGESLAARLTAERELAAALERLKRTLDQSVGALAQMIDKRDPYTAGHQARVARIAEAIARDLGLTEDEVETIRLGALMHDIGKIAVPSEILTKPGKLIEEEMALVRLHPLMGGEIVAHIDFAPAIHRIVTQHHERLDGSGYPHGLKGDDIAFEARIVAVADVLEAITSHRPYRPALGLDRALEELRHQRGVTLDARVVDTCLVMLDRQTVVPGLEGIVSPPVPLPAE